MYHLATMHIIADRRMDRQLTVSCQ